MRSKLLTSKEAARLLGVSEASVKRWADGGLLAQQKTAGGHRRFRPEDVAAFRRAGLQPTAQHARQPASPRVAALPTRGAGSERALAAAMYETLVAGRVEEAAALLVNLYLRGRSVAALADKILCPPLVRVGELWQQGKLSVAEEHVAARTAMLALQTLRGALATPVVEHGLPALCCSSEDDFHELPVHIAALTLEANGWEVVNLGACTPFYALAEAVGRFNPRLVCIASTILNGLDRAAREYEALRKAAQRVGAAIVLGGTGFAAADVRRRFPAELHADSFQQLESFAATRVTTIARAQAR